MILIVLFHDTRSTMEIHAQISQAYLQKMKCAFGKPYFAKQPIYWSLHVNTLFSGDGMEFSGVF